MSLSPHLQDLEQESIYIIREMAACFHHPAMLYSIGKDSSVMLHLAKKAFAPGRLPFPLVHVDTLWKFREMIAFRDQIAQQERIDLRVYVNPKGYAPGTNPFEQGSAVHTDIMKTQALRQMIDHYRFDALLGGARRDEEASRAKERIFSFRDAQQVWNPKAQRPEVWDLLNSTLGPGENVRVFPLSNWTELDVWHYIWAENIAVPELYFAKQRPVVEYQGTLILVDDDRVPEPLRQTQRMEWVRFRTLGCYPLTGAVRSHAQTVPEIIEEMQASEFSERQGRLIDKDQFGSMEKKKVQGYF
jgi:sulfate adenylyltransferase subunit 2